MMKKFYVIRFEDGKYVGNSHIIVDFSEARVYTLKNHATSSMKIINRRYAQCVPPLPSYSIIEVEVAEPE